MYSGKVTLIGWVKGCTEMVSEGTAPTGRPKKMGQNCVSED